MKKERLDRKHRGIKGKRPDKKVKRIETADQNKKKYDALTPIQKLAKLDHKLGEGVGAIRQRQKLQDIIEGKTSRVQEVALAETSTSEDEQKKHLKAKDRKKLQQKHNRVDENAE